MMGATQQCSVLNLRDASAMRRLVIVADNSLIVQAIRIGFHKSGEFKLIGTANAPDHLGADHPGPVAGR